MSLENALKLWKTAISRIDRLNYRESPIEVIAMFIYIDNHK